MIILNILFSLVEEVFFVIAFGILLALAIKIVFGIVRFIGKILS